MNEWYHDDDDDDMMVMVDASDNHKEARENEESRG